MSAARKRSIVSLSKMGDALLEQLYRAFPFGFEDNFITINDGRSGSYKGVVWETETMTYLIKFDAHSQLSIVEDDSDDEQIHFEADSDEEE